jgi:hypothetical protein
VLVGKVEDGQLVATVVGKLVDHDEHADMADLGDADLTAGGDAVVGTRPQDDLQLPQEAGFVGELFGMEP